MKKFKDFVNEAKQNEPVNEINKANATKEFSKFKKMGLSGKQLDFVKFIEDNYRSWNWYEGIDGAFGDMHLIIASHLTPYDVEEILEIMKKYNMNLSPSSAYGSVSKQGYLSLRYRP